MSIHRNLALIAAVLVALIGGTGAAVKLTTDHLLYLDATSAARNWAQSLAENVKDLEQIAAGELPTVASTEFLQWAQKVGQVFRYEIFNREGFPQLVSERGGVALVDISKFSPAAAQAIATGRPIVAVKEGRWANWPSFYAEAYVPVVVGRQPIAVVAAYVDQSEQREQVRTTFLIAAVSLCLLTALAFAIPGAAWYRRTKEKQRAEERIRYLAHHDVMTGLDNRHHLIEKLQRALTVLPTRGGKLALHYIDLDRFKDVNDTFGHDFGDSLVQAVADRLRSVAEKGDVIARIGGDEFTIVQPQIASRSEAEMLARRVIAALEQPFLVNGRAMSVTGSIGIAIAPTDAIDVVQLMRRADLALYKSKADGRNCVRVFTPQMDLEKQARFELESQLRHAVANEGFQLHFQPVFDSVSRRLLGFEALLRLLQPKDAPLLSPATFIPVAEEIGLIDDIARWVLREACRTAVGWPEALTVAINLSPAQFNAGSVHDMVAAALAETGLQPNRLELEITEGLLLGDTEGVMRELGKLKDLGVAIVMDDFGTGYSSLNYLWRFRFDKIKIDRSFMSDLDNADRDTETAVKALVALGHSLNIQVTVEGVENDWQAAFVRNIAVDQVQGFFFGRPMPASEIASSILADFQSGALNAGPSVSRPTRATSDGLLG